jgi:hypothetical protein
VLASDWWKTSFQSQLGQFEWNVVPFGLQGASSLLTRVMNQALTVGLDFPGDQTAGPAGQTAIPARCLPRPAFPPIHCGVPGASGPLGRCALVYMDRQLFAKSSKCEFGRLELGFLGHSLSQAGVSVDPRKVQSIVEWATPTSCCEVRRFTGLAK